MKIEDMISNNRADCSGCSACANICPKNCISMERDAEGFAYPQINHELCVQCGRCEKVCPAKNISRPNGSPVWQHHCVECLGCLNVCPKQAIDCGDVTKGRKRYIHWQIKPSELVQK